jgi:hypothetical protein
MITPKTGLGGRQIKALRRKKPGYRRSPGGLHASAGFFVPDASAADERVYFTPVG